MAARAAPAHPTGTASTLRMSARNSCGARCVSNCMPRAALITIRPSDRPGRCRLPRRWRLVCPAGGGSVWSGGLWPGVLAGWLGVLYLPDTPLHHRMVSLDGQCLAMTACYTLGIISHRCRPACCRRWHVAMSEQYDLPVLSQVNPPGSLFFHGGGDWRVFSGRAAASTIQGELVGAGLSAGLRGGFCLQPVYSVAPCHGRCSLATRQLRVCGVLIRC